MVGVGTHCPVPSLGPTLDIHVSKSEVPKGSAMCPHFIPCHFIFLEIFLFIWFPFSWIFCKSWNTISHGSLEPNEGRKQ